MKQPRIFHHFKSHTIHVWLDPDADGLVPSEVSSVFFADQVLAILDVRSADLAAGRVFLTEASMQILSKMKDGVLEVEGESRKRAGRKRKEAPADPPPRSFKFIAKRLRTLGAVRMTRAAAAAEAEGKEEHVASADIRRSDKGRQVIRRLVVKAAELDLTHFDSSPAFDPVTKMATIKNIKDYKYQDFIAQVLAFFQYKYFAIRSPEAFGSNVHRALSKVLEELRASPPCRKSFLKLISDCRSAKLDGSIQI